MATVNCARFVNQIAINFSTENNFEHGIAIVVLQTLAYNVLVRFNIVYLLTTIRMRLLQYTVMILTLLLCALAILKIPMHKYSHEFSSKACIEDGTAHDVIRKHTV